MAAANQAAPPAPVDNIPDRESLKETRNYEVNKTISHTRRVPGSLQKLSVAVVVDHATNANGDREPLNQALLDQVNALVREAIGFSAERGDTVQIINSPFVAPAPMEPIPEPGFLEQPGVGAGSRASGGSGSTSTHLCRVASHDPIFHVIHSAHGCRTVSIRERNG